MNDIFESKVIPMLMGNEGGYSNKKNDLETNWGITILTARAHGYHGQMRDLSRSQAVSIYRSDYWTGPRYDLVAQVSEAVALELADTGVNMGPSVASKFLQRSLNVFNRQAVDYPDIATDGAIGDRTLAALKLMVRRNGIKATESRLLKALNCLQGAEYIAICERNKGKEDFVNGWFDNRVGGL